MKYNKICEVCKTEHFNSRPQGKYCSQICSRIGSKGKKNPHNKEWEEKRLAAVRANAWKTKGRKSPKSKITIEIAGKKYQELRSKNPGKYNEQSIKNLSKNNTLDNGRENSPNWKGGVSAEIKKWRNNNTKPLKEWKMSVLERDSYSCRDCGSKENLCSHHIIPVKENKSAAFLRMNGVTLCKDCHYKTEDYGGKRKEKFKLEKFSLCGINFQYKVIPSTWFDYNSAGNYAVDLDGNIILFVAKMENELYEDLVKVHEIIEVILILKRGIKISDIDKFDMVDVFELDQKNSDDPGVSKLAPYHKEHMFATKIEKLLCKELELDWETYDQSFDKLKY